MVVRPRNLGAETEQAARTVKAITQAAVEAIKAERTSEQPCHHPSGFLLMGRTSPDGVNTYESVYCPHCSQRRMLAPDWRVIATREVGKEWEYCRT